MIVGIMGKAGAGKDTVAEILKSELRFEHMRLADPMKEFCAEVFGFSREQLWGPSENRNKVDERWLYNEGKHEFSNMSPFCCVRCGAMFSSVPCGLTPRKALQTLGTEWGRAMHPDTWVRILVRRAKGSDVLNAFGEKVGYTVRRVVVSDVRFKNEFDAIKADGGKMIRVVRPVDNGMRGAAAVHASETEQDSIPDYAFDAVVRNDGTIPQLSAAVKEIVRGWL